MFKKTSDDVKKYIKLSMIFSAIFREKLIQNQAKIMENGFVHNIGKESTLGAPFARKQAIFR